MHTWGASHLVPFKHTYIRIESWRMSAVAKSERNRCYAQNMFMLTVILHKKFMLDFKMF